MKREEKSALSRQRILDAAMEEFARNGYSSASMNTICAENGISKGIIYHYFSDRDELYLLCVERCFGEITEYLREAARSLSGAPERKLEAYFDARLRFFSGNRECLGIFTDAVFSPPEGLAPKIAELRRGFDELNIAVLTELLSDEPLREGLTVEAVVRDFGMYMDYFNLHFKLGLSAPHCADGILREHEEMCLRQLNILLYGVIGDRNES